MNLLKGPQKTRAGGRGRGLGKKRFNPRLQVLTVYHTGSWDHYLYEFENWNLSEPDSLLSLKKLLFLHQDSRSFNACTQREGVKNIALSDISVTI